VLELFNFTIWNQLLINSFMLQQRCCKCAGNLCL